ncbi:MAG: hypothetical protein HYY17_04915 [Planctomycetes bacterium]|nr:hypothetical protein [Planctomycetota bacterium]
MGRARTETLTPQVNPTFLPFDRAAAVVGLSPEALKLMHFRGLLGPGVVVRLGVRRLVVDVEVLVRWLRSRPVRKVAR